MRILDVSPITATAQMPVKAGTLQFLQDAWTNAIADIIQGSIVGGCLADTAYVLYGCYTISGTPGNVGSGAWSIAAGAVFYNNEVFEVPAATGTNGAGQVAVMNVVTTQYSTNADPVIFTDGSTQNVHDIRTYNITAGTTGYLWTDLVFGLFGAAAQASLGNAISANSTAIGNINAAWTPGSGPYTGYFAIAGVTVTGTPGYGFKYKIIGKTMMVNFSLTFTHSSGAVSGITITLPTGTIANDFNCGVPIVFQDGTNITGYATTQAGGNTIIILPATSLSASTETSVAGSLTFEIQ